jgi:hypothetical protein
VRIAVGICLLARFAAADPDPAGPNPTDKAEADRLFEQARDLLGKGDRAEACKLFDLSLRKDPRAVGTMLNVALCREEGGAIATAVKIYAEARDRAQDQNLTEHHDAAERKLALLASRVPHVKIQLPSNAPPTTRVIVDDLVLSLDQLADLEIDPGQRSLVVAAPDKLPYETKLEIKEGEHRVVVVPPLEGPKTVVISRPAPPFDRRLYGRIGVAAGAVLAGATLGTGYYAYHLYWSQFPQAAHDGAATSVDPTKHCFTYDGTRNCDATGSNHLSHAHTLGNVATGLGVASIVTLGVGTYLWATAPKLAIDIAPGHIAFSTQF